MRRTICSIASLLLVAASADFRAARAQADAKPAAPRRAEGAAQPAPADPARLERLLKMWEKRSAQLKTLDVELKRHDRSKAWGSEEFIGRVMLKSPNLAMLDFSKVVVNDKGQETLVHDERIVCTGNEVWQYKTDTRQIFIFPLEEGAQTRALQEGPLPFLFNMRADDAKRRYVMSLNRETESSYIVVILPRFPIDQQAFSKAVVQLSKEYFLPTRIVLISPDQKSQKDFEIPPDKIRANKSVSDENFKGVVLKKPWQVVRNPDGGTPERAGAGAAAPRQPAMQPRANARPRR